MEYLIYILGGILIEFLGIFYYINIMKLLQTTENKNSILFYFFTCVYFSAILPHTLRNLFNIHYYSNLVTGFDMWWSQLHWIVNLQLMDKVVTLIYSMLLTILAEIPHDSTV